ncbi:MAG: 3-hydroxyacyl-[acyl-carrier-protein] dehydratase FabZ [Bdellovibrionales bacterium CG10_big_fil_rev_8_21_14_0_10_45_34]|nr:MAG: 3-hydroxyacyl-[acyl-carrier-protein] dehydratase FabZ [Bdellovibrionales bacterium CG10_big_fil_rev_8_21_14_0_10_45_34]
MDICGIQEILPHRYPFLLVDRVLKREKKNPNENHVGDRIVTLKNVTLNEPFFVGHFPHLPVMPGVLQIEALAQSCGLLAHIPHPEGKKWDVFILGVDNAKFRKQVTPGDTLIMKAEIIKARTALYVFSCSAEVEGETVSQAELMAKMFA